jgi:hypothetical protein
MILCHEVIWLSKSSSTYCMRERGHEGKHNIENCEPVEEKKDDTKQENKNKTCL